jgi:hypothetical protein
MAAAVISFVSILLLNRVPPLQPRERAMLTNHEELRISLAHDDLATAQRIFCEDDARIQRLVSSIFSCPVDFK